MFKEKVFMLLSTDWSWIKSRALIFSFLFFFCLFCFCFCFLKQQPWPDRALQWTLLLSHYYSIILCQSLFLIFFQSPESYQWHRRAARSVARTVSHHYRGTVWPTALPFPFPDGSQPCWRERQLLLHPHQTRCVGSHRGRQQTVWREIQGLRLSSWGDLCTDREWVYSAAIRCTAIAAI